MNINSSSAVLPTTSAVVKDNLIQQLLRFRHTNRWRLTDRQANRGKRPLIGAQATALPKKITTRAALICHVTFLKVELPLIHTG